MIKEIKFSEQIPISAHLKELKDRVVLVAMVISVNMGICYYFLNSLLAWLQLPLPKEYKELTFISPTEPFFTALSVCLLGSMFLSMPVILFQIWKFIAPGLKMKEKKITLLFVLSGTFFFLLGGTFCYYLVLPLGLKFLLQFGSSFWKMEVTIGLYYSFTLKLIMAFAFAFQTPLLMVLLTKTGAINTVKMKLYRKWAFLGCFIVAAVLTPPDVITQTLLGIPLYCLYEFGVVVSYFFEDPKNREAAIKEIIQQREARRAMRESAATEIRKPAKKAANTSS